MRWKWRKRPLIGRIESNQFNINWCLGFNYLDVYPRPAYHHTTVHLLTGDIVIVLATDASRYLVFCSYNGLVETNRENVKIL